MKLNSPPPSDPTLLSALDSVQKKSAISTQTTESAEQDPSSAAANSLSQGDQTAAQVPARHESEANTVHFGEPAETSASETPSNSQQPVSSEASTDGPTAVSTHPSQANSPSNEPARPSSGSSSRNLEHLQDAFRKQGESAYADPAVLKLLDYVREQEDKNVKQMLDMLQQSLDRAREMMEQNKEDFYKKTLPQMQKAEQAVQEMQLNQEAQQTQQLQEAGSQVAQALQSAQTQLSQAPVASPQLAQAQSELAFANLLSTLL